MSLLRKPTPQPSYEPRDFTAQSNRLEETGWLSDKAKAAAKSATGMAEKLAVKTLGKARTNKLKGLAKGTKKKKEKKEKEDKEKEDKE
jgi:hypothetical protein